MYCRLRAFLAGSQDITYAVIKKLLRWGVVFVLLGLALGWFGPFWLPRGVGQVIGAVFFWIGVIVIAARWRRPRQPL